MLSLQSVYMPYLGKNDHPAAITKVAIVELAAVDTPRYIDSLHKVDHIRYDTYGKLKKGQAKSFFKEFMPMGLNEANNGYIQQPLVMTNHAIDEETISDED